jgi:hypothetical protein
MSQADPRPIRTARRDGVLPVPHAMLINNSRLAPTPAETDRLDRVR